MTKSKGYLWILSVCLLAVAFTTVIWPNNKAQGLAKATWEYKFIDSALSSGAERALNQLGSEGWELVQVAETDQGKGTYILKRAR